MNYTAENWAEVASKHALASNGDTITVKPGSYTATSRITILKYIRLVCTGVTVTDNTPPTVDVLSLVESTDGSIRVEDLKIMSRVTHAGGTNALITLTPTLGGHPIVLSYCVFDSGSSGEMVLAKGPRGVISGCIFTAQLSYVPGANCFNNAGGVVQKYGTFESNNWADPSTLGALDLGGVHNLYIEDCKFVNVLAAVDSDDSARMVVRHCTLTNSALSSHGPDTSWVGSRQLEVYSVRFIRDTTPAACCGSGSENMPVNMNSWIGLRGGTMVVWDCDIDNLNDPFWGDKPEIALQVYPPWRKAGPYACWTSGYPVPHQVGQPEPVYVWGNSGSGASQPVSLEGYPNECGATGSVPLSDFLKNGRDLILAPKPGYIPYTYPHPLVAGAPPVEPPVEPPFVVVPPVKVTGTKTDVLNVQLRFAHIKANAPLWNGSTEWALVSDYGSVRHRVNYSTSGKLIGLTSELQGSNDGGKTVRRIDWRPGIATGGVLEGEGQFTHIRAVFDVRGSGQVTVIPIYFGSAR